MRFGLTTPAKKPWTEWDCQPVAFTIVAMVAPCRACRIAITRACFESLRLGVAEALTPKADRFDFLLNGWVGRRSASIAPSVPMMRIPSSS